MKEKKERERIERKNRKEERRREGKKKKKKKKKGQKLIMYHITTFQSMIYHIYDSATPYSLGDQ